MRIPRPFGLQHINKNIPQFTVPSTFLCQQSPTVCEATFLFSLFPHGILFPLPRQRHTIFLLYQLNGKLTNDDFPQRLSRSVPSLTLFTISPSCRKIFQSLYQQLFAHRPMHIQKTYWHLVTHYNINKLYSSFFPPPTLSIPMCV